MKEWEPSSHPSLARTRAQDTVGWMGKARQVRTQGGSAVAVSPPTVAHRFIQSLRSQHQERFKDGVAWMGAQQQSGQGKLNVHTGQTASQPPGTSGLRLPDTHAWSCRGLLGPGKQRTHPCAAGGSAPCRCLPPAPTSRSQGLRGCAKPPPPCLGTERHRRRRV